MDNPQISSHVPSMCFYNFELFTELLEELIEHISLVFRSASSAFSVFPAFLMFLNFNKTLFWGENSGGNGENHMEGISYFQ